MITSNVRYLIWNSQQHSDIWIYFKTLNMEQKTIRTAAHLLWRAKCCFLLLLSQFWSTCIMLDGELIIMTLFKDIKWIKETAGVHPWGHPYPPGQAEAAHAARSLCCPVKMCTLGSPLLPSRLPGGCCTLNRRSHTQNKLIPEGQGKATPLGSWLPLLAWDRPVLFLTSLGHSVNMKEIKTNTKQ